MFTSDEIQKRVKQNPFVPMRMGEQLKSWWEMGYSGGGLNSSPEKLPRSLSWT